MTQPIGTKKSGFRWLLISGVSFFLLLGLTILLTEVFGLPEEASYAIGIVVVMASNFLFCRYYIFEAGSESFFKQLGGFLAGTIVFRPLEYLTFLGLHTGLGLDYRLTVAVVSVGALVAKFFTYKRFVFRRPASSPAMT
ncbi:MAG: GtrA family protein [Planctomycetota bacterium]